MYKITIQSVSTISSGIPEQAIFNSSITGVSGATGSQKSHRGSFGVINPNLSVAVNSVGQLEFDMTEECHVYSSFGYNYLLCSTVRVYDYSSSRNNIIFIGIPVKSELMQNGNLHVTCLGTGYRLSKYVVYEPWDDSSIAYGVPGKPLKYIVSDHVTIPYHSAPTGDEDKYLIQNDSIPAEWKITHNIQSDIQSTYFAKENDDKVVSCCYDVLKKWVTDKFPVFWVMVGNKLNIVDKELGTNSQKIYVGDNVKAISYTEDATDVINTAVVIRKNTQSNNEEPRYIKASSHAKRGISKIGKVCGYTKLGDDSGTSRDEYATLASNMIAQHGSSDPNVKITVTAIDKSFVAGDSPIKLGYKTTVYWEQMSKFGNPYRDLICTAIDYDLANPINSTYTFGSKKSLFTNTT